MSIDSHRRDAERYRSELVKLQSAKSREAESAAKETARSNAAAASASASTSASTARSKARDSQRYAEAAAKHQKNIASLEAQIARAHERINNAERRLNSELQAEDKKRLSELKKTEQAHLERMRSVSKTLAAHSGMHAATNSAIERLTRLPTKITVLFFAANPLDQNQLRLDEEVRAISEMIRKSEHRDSVVLESRWAVRPLDLLQALNECEPHVVHFSGHGSDAEELVFQDNSGKTKLVSKEAIVQTLVASSSSIELVFFNSCYSASQAEAVVQHVPAAIGMNTEIGDDAARVFAAAFYSAIGFGKSVAKAFAQGKAALMLEGIPEELTPELFVAPGRDANEMVLVRVERSNDQANDSTSI